MADVDGDGRKDALVTHGGWERLGVYRQFPNGDFLAEELYAIPYASAYEPQGLAVGDINGDGRPDAVIADYNRRADRASTCRRNAVGAGGHRAGSRRDLLHRRAPHRPLGHR